MKKNIFILATAAIALIGCAETESLKNDVSNNENIPFTFAAYSNKATKADNDNHNTLNFFYKTFNVYGWKSYGQPNDWSIVFNNETNEYFGTNAHGQVIYTEASSVLPGDEWGQYGHSASAWDAGWYYEGINYWDKFATNYQFCAYAPFAASSQVVCTPDGVIKIGDNGTGANSKGTITVDNKNLMATPAKDLAYTGFDYDYMTAAVATSSTGAIANSSPVQLVFTHELAKFNIKILLNTNVTTTQTVTVNEVSIKNIKGTSYYTSAEDVASPNNGYLSGWATPVTNVAYLANGVGSATDGYQINGDLNTSDSEFDNYSGYYIMERLMIPQTIAKTTPASQRAEFTAPCIYVKYTIGSEEYTGHWGLANLFDTTSNTELNILGGNEYTLTITVGPEPIYFTAAVTPWQNNEGAIEF